MGIKADLFPHIHARNRRVADAEDGEHLCPGDIILTGGDSSDTLVYPRPEGDVVGPDALGALALGSFLTSQELRFVLRLHKGRPLVGHLT